MHIPVILPFLLATSSSKSLGKYFLAMQVFHASRESFLYLKEFYIGELEPSDRALVPCEVPPSEDFLQQLHEYTSFRMPISQKVFKSF